MFHVPAHKQVSPAAQPAQVAIPALRFEHISDYEVFRRMLTVPDKRLAGEFAVELDYRGGAYSRH